MKKEKKKITKKQKKYVQKKVAKNKKQNLKKTKTTNLPKQKVKVRKIKYGRILLAFLVFFLLIYLIVNLIKFPIKNIFIYDNTYLKDQQIIEMAQLQDYPSIFYKSTISIEKMLEKSIYIKDAIVKKKKLKEIHIYIKENRPLYYDLTEEKTIFEDSKTLKEKLNIPILINYVPDNVLPKFVEKMSKVDTEILDRISEIKYEPNSVDEERFLLTMNDGNYVYLTLNKFEKINRYLVINLDISQKYEKKQGILYLDSGEYFKILE